VVVVIAIVVMRVGLRQSLAKAQPPYERLG
jgi:hypothetical protein